MKTSVLANRVAVKEFCESCRQIATEHIHQDRSRRIETGHAEEAQRLSKGVLRSAAASSHHLQAGALSKSDVEQHGRLEQISDQIHGASISSSLHKVRVGLNVSLVTHGCISHPVYDHFVCPAASLHFSHREGAPSY